jgi:hypothetical protein
MNIYNIKMSAALAAAKRRRLTQMPTTMQPESIQYQPQMAQISLPQSNRQVSVPIQTPTPQQTNQNVPPNQPSIVSTTSPLPLQQIISIIDSRLLFLEKFVSTSQSSETSLRINESVPDLDKLKGPNFNEEWNDKVQEIVAEMLKDYIEEMDSRYEILATEILHLKNTLTSIKAYTIESLQTFTLDTDKSMIDERMRIINELSTIDVNGDFSENIQTELDEIADNDGQLEGEDHVEVTELPSEVSQMTDSTMAVFA